jgi:hypothetical protein
MIINRIFDQANKWTFQMQSVKSLLLKYNVGKGWVDPYAGRTSPAEFTNDLNPDSIAKYHMDAKDFVLFLDGKYKGILFDPPYSFRQVTEHYAKNGIKATSLDTSNNFYKRVIDGIYNKIIPGGHAISFGWNSTGFGKYRGFEIIEILLINHGSHHNDTIVTVEEKINNQGSLFE